MMFAALSSTVGCAGAEPNAELSPKSPNELLSEMSGVDSKAEKPLLLGAVAGASSNEPRRSIAGWAAGLGGGGAGAGDLLGAGAGAGAGERVGAARAGAGDGAATGAGAGAGDGVVLGTAPPFAASHSSGEPGAA